MYKMGWGVLLTPLYFPIRAPRHAGTRCECERAGRPGESGSICGPNIPKVDASSLLTRAVLWFLWYLNYSYSFKLKIAVLEKFYLVSTIMKCLTGLLMQHFCKVHLVIV